MRPCARQHDGGGGGIPQLLGVAGEVGEGDERGSRDREQPMPDARSATDPMPPAWASLLTDGQWQKARTSIGAQRLDELRPLLEGASPTFRRLFIGHLTEERGNVSPGAHVVLSLARAAHDLSDEVCTGREAPQRGERMGDTMQRSAGAEQ